MNILANMTLPSPETLAAYEKLGIVAILLGIVIVGMWVALLIGKQIFGWVKDYGISVLNQLNQQTMALESVKQSNASMEVHQTRLHERMDWLLRCPAPSCPLRPTDHQSVKASRGTIVVGSPSQNKPPTQNI